MPRSLLATFAVAVALAACGAETPERETPGAIESPIINGTECGADVETTSVAVLVKGTVKLGSFKQEINSVVCTGTLIAPDVVLTAAHCVDPVALTGGFGTAENVRYFVTFEPDLRALAEQRTTTFPDDAVEATSWVKNAEFSLSGQGQVDGVINFKDVAVMFLATPFDQRPEVVITKAEAAQVVQGAPVKIVGWGLNRVVSGGPFAQPPAGSSGRKICGESVINELGEFEMQIGSDTSSTRKCHGDSGGPTFFTADVSGTQKRRVIGITSHAYNSTEDCNRGGVDTRVDAWWDWIDGQLRDACTAGKRQWCKVEGIIPPEYFDAHPEWNVLGDDPPDAGPAITENTDGGTPIDGSGGDAKDEGCAQAGAAAAAASGLAGLLRRRRTLLSR